MSRKEYRLDSAPPTLGDLRQLYKALKLTDDRCAHMQAQLHILAAQRAEDARKLATLTGVINTLIKMMHPLPGDRPSPPDPS